MYINWFTWIIFFHDPICYTKNWGNDKSQSSLNLMVNYHYHSETRVTTYKLTSMLTILESVQEERDTPLLESYNKQQIYRWVRYHLCIPYIKHQLYTEWELRESCERRVMVKSTYTDILDECWVPKTNLWRTLNVLFTPLKCSSLKHLWYLAAVGKVKRQRVR